MRKNSEAKWVLDLLVPGKFMMRMSRVLDSDKPSKQFLEYGKIIGLAVGQTILYVGGTGLVQEYFR